jgi:hypothetical protein
MPLTSLAMPPLNIIPTGIITVTTQLPNSTLFQIVYTVPATYNGIPVTGLRIMSYWAFNLTAVARNIQTDLTPSGGVEYMIAQSALLVNAQYVGVNLLNKTDFPGVFLDECGNYVFELMAGDVLKAAQTVAAATAVNVMLSGRFF